MNEINTLFTSKIAKYLEHPEEIDLDQVEQLLEIYPYFSGLHLLRIKKAQTIQHPQFHEILSEAAVNLKDRELLFEWLIRKPLKLRIANAIEEIKEFSELESKEKTDKLPPAPTSLKTTNNENLQVGSDENKESDQKEEEVKKKLEEELLKTIQSEAGVYFTDEDKVLKPKKEVVGKMSFADWLLALSSEEVEQEVKVEKQTVNTLKPTQKIKSTNEDKSDKKQIQKSLIDKFLEKTKDGNEKISPKLNVDRIQGRKDYAEFTDESGVIITETLAKIYEAQGNITKAIEAYGFLSTKYPEKSSYFAAQISKLKDL